MNANLPTKSTSRLGLPTPPLATLDLAVRTMANKLTPVGLGFEIAAVNAPTPELRRDLQVRASALDHWLRPAGDSALDEITAIFMMPAKSVEAGDAKARMRLYERDLADVPLFALSKACSDFRQGRAGDGWRPTQTDIRKQAEQHSQPFRAERLKIGNVLAATIIDIRDNPERRKAIADKLREVARSVSMEGKRAEYRRLGRTFDEEQERPESPTEALERLKAENESGPMTLRPDVRRKAQQACGVDSAAWEERQRLEVEFNGQEGRAA